MSSVQSIEHRNTRLGFKVDIPQNIYTNPRENKNGIIFGRGATYSIGCYRGSLIESLYYNVIQRLKNQGVQMLIDRWEDFRGSSIIHTKLKMAGTLSEQYFIQGKRAAYTLEVGHPSSYQTAAHWLHGMYLESLRDSFEELEAIGSGGYGGTFRSEPPDVGYGEKTVKEFENWSLYDEYDDI
jgi:hypothetical protein